MSTPTIPPITDHLAVSLRAFAGPQFVELREPSKRKRKSSRQGASSWALIFDTETKTDAGQSFRFGTYQVRNNGELKEAGICYDPEGVTADELATLRSHADANGLRLLSLAHFVDDIFFGIGWRLRAAIVGFNLPFDISRLAFRHGSARSREDGSRNDMRGGFTFSLSRQKIYPNVLVKHLSQRMAFIRFAGTMGAIDSRSARGRKDFAPIRRGHFIDVKTLAGALFARSFSLGQLSEFLKVDHPKLDFDDFTGPVTDEMARYAVRDVQTTWECYDELLTRLRQLGLPDLLPEKVYSEASIGKAYIRAMGIMPWTKLQPNFPRQMLANIMGSYFGGRSEVRIRRELRQVILCDFLSMYPTVCTLMGLWRFVIAEVITWRDSTDETRVLLAAVDIAALQSRSAWANLATLVRVKPDGDIFPVRAAYSGEVQTTIGANHLTSDQPLCFTLADCIAAKLLTGKPPEVVEAITFEPGPIQSALCPIDVSGNPAYRVDPVTTDFFKRVIELRQSVKARRNKSTGEERITLEIEENSLKIVANATSYGMWVETNVATRSKKIATTIHTATCQLFSFQTDKAEEPGPYFHPLLATLITGAARLMLAIAETLVAQSGLEWAFCDTDSMAIAKPNEIPPDEFAQRVSDIVAWFEALNPYDFGGSILKIEDENASLETGESEPLYCWAISSKRYALFNIATDSAPIMRKVSAHGLGQLLPPYRGDDPAIDIPMHHPSVLGKGIEVWHADLWWQIVSAALARHPDRVRLNYHPALVAPAVSRYGATSPELLGWFGCYNEARPAYRDQVKPFGFLLSMSARSMSEGERIINGQSAGRRKRPKPPKPIATFERDFAAAVAGAFDRNTGESVPGSLMKSYAEALAQYHIQPEAKFLNADYLDRGTTRRRHARMILARHIGKESNDWERQAVLGLNADSHIDYGFSDSERTSLHEKLTVFMGRVGMMKAAKALNTTPVRLRSLTKMPGVTKADNLLRLIASRLPAASSLYERIYHDRQAELERLRKRVERDGLRTTARALDIDPSNLRRRLR
jgi:hypothetical protein